MLSDYVSIFLSWSFAKNLWHCLPRISTQKSVGVLCVCVEWNTMCVFRILDINKRSPYNLVPASLPLQYGTKFFTGHWNQDFYGGSQWPHSQFPRWASVQQTLMVSSLLFKVCMHASCESRWPLSENTTYFLILHTCTRQHKHVAFKLGLHIRIKKKKLWKKH